MVSYYNHAAMYRHQQAVAAQQQFHAAGSPMPWYPSYHHQNSQTTATPSYCMQEEQMWHHAQPPHPMFHHEFNEFVHAGMQSQHPQIGENENTQLPSPPITVSGSEMSSPGAGGNISPANTQHTRPAPVRSPYEWIKKTSYQSQPNPGKTRTKDKYRVVYTDHQRVELEKEFYYSRYITIRRKAELASNLGLSERQVKIWFQNRRAKERKQVKKREEFTQKDTITAVTMQMQQQQQNLLHSATATTAVHNHHQTQLPSSVVHSVPVPLI